MDTEVLVHIYIVEYYSAIKKEKNWVRFSEVDETKAVIQSKVSQKKKKKYCILKHIYGIKKMVLMNLFAGQE